MKRFLTGLMAVLLLFTAWLVTAAGSYDLSWFTVDGGGGSSSGGSFTLSGTIGQPDAGSMQGGNFDLVGGFWGGICSLPLAPAVGIGITNGQVELTWTPVSGAASYNVHRAADDPYFAPGAPYATGVTSPWLDPDPGAVGNPVSNYYYAVQTTNTCGESASNRRLGVFDFAMQPGS